MPKAKVHQTSVWKCTEQSPLWACWTDSPGTNSASTDARLESFLWVTHCKVHFRVTFGWHTESRLLSQNPISQTVNQVHMWSLPTKTVNSDTAIISLYTHTHTNRKARNSGFKNIFFVCFLLLFLLQCGILSRSSLLNGLPQPPSPPPPHGTP